jgi:undecaprenyl diphosphate synthase
MAVEYPELAELAATGRVPRHIAVIMDGNGRWAKMRGLPRLSGHKAGSETVRRLLGYCRDAGVDYLTLYAFSTENWGRPPEEVSGLMQLLGNFIADNEKELLAQQIRLRLIGRREDLPAELLGSIERMEAATAGFKRQLLVALSYSGRSELVHAARQIAGQVKSGALDPQEIGESTIAANLYAPDVPDPDLIIRTSGELRVSNFLLWQCAYSEFYVTPVLWPDFDEATFADAIKAYMARNRRYGKV